MKKTIVSMLVFMAFSSTGFSQEKKSSIDEHNWEIWTGGLANISFIRVNYESATSISLMGNSVGVTQSSLNTANPTIGYIVSSQVEIVLSPSFGLYNESAPDSSSRVTLFQPQLGVNLSFSDRMEDSFYLQLEAGVTIWSSDYSSKTNFSWDAQLGKRFSINANVTYAPAIEFMMVTSSPPITSFSIIPVQFSFFL